MGVESAELLRRTQMALTLSTLVKMLAETKRVDGRTAKTCDLYPDMLSRFATYVGEDTPLAEFSNFV